MKLIRSIVLGCVVAAAGCAPAHHAILDPDHSQVQLRSIQSRSFETTDREKTLRAIIATLQDLSFVVDKADLELGTVSATKLDGYALRMTVSIRPKGKTETIVRANAQYNDRPVLEPQPYQSFFVALERAMFLSANAVD